MVCHTAILLKDDMAQVSDLQNSLAKNQTVLKNRACGYDEIRKFCHIDKLSSPLANPEDVDILEQNIRELSPYLLKILLQDKTTGRYIRWACDEYAKYGEAYTAEKEIFPELITGPNTKIIQPRIAKSKEDQLNRTRKSAEVFTPSWICAEMNNLCDEEWFGEPNVFNQVIDKTWEPTLNKISFKETNKRKKAEWQRYVDSKRLEITCGEAPFLVSRYDTTTGEVLPIIKRIGLLDRKLRIVNENMDNEADWFVWAKRAYESTYGYEYQGDNLLLARENLLWTFIDNYKYKFQQFPAIAHLKQIANIIAWNIWQMDGLKECAPFVASEASQLELFNDLPTLSFPIICRIKDWRNKLVFYFRDLKGDKKMKFDYVIGNPPYQMDADSDSETNGQKPRTNIFHYFQMQSDEIVLDTSVLIYPGARWMHQSGKGLKEFGKNQLNDKRLSNIYFYPNVKEIFGTAADLSDGITIVVKKQKKDTSGFKYTYIQNGKRQTIELKNPGDDLIPLNPNDIEISNKIREFIKNKHINFLHQSILPRTLFGIESDFVAKNPSKVKLLEDGYKLQDNEIKLLTNDKAGSAGRARWFVVDRSIIENGIKYLDEFQVVVSSANAAGKKRDSQMEIIKDRAAFGRARVALRSFKSYQEAQNFYKYLSSYIVKYSFLLTGDALTSLGKLVPDLGNYIDNSIIDFSKDINVQLAQLISLDENEVAYIKNVIDELR